MTHHDQHGQRVSKAHQNQHELNSVLVGDAHPANYKLVLKT
jgi:hypothetical protein